ncbi:hypothetical protein CDEF62S_04076 [Castellaniella defragrans]
MRSPSGSGPRAFIRAVAYKQRFIEAVLHGDLNEESWCKGVVLGSGPGVVCSGDLSSARELDQIKQSGEIRIAINEGLPMFSFLGPDLQPEGSDIAAAKLLAKDLGVKLKLVSVSTAARIRPSRRARPTSR